MHAFLTILADFSSPFIFLSLPFSKFKKKKNQCHKSVRLNSAHMTFPSSLIASIQFISASHARPQSIKQALLQRSSCPIITPIIKMQELWVRSSQMMSGETNRFLNSPKAGRKQVKARQSTIRLPSKNTGALAQMEIWESPPSQPSGQRIGMKSDTVSLGCSAEPPHNVT